MTTEHDRSLLRSASRRRSRALVIRGVAKVCCLALTLVAVPAATFVHAQQDTVDDTESGPPANRTVNGVLYSDSYGVGEGADDDVDPPEYVDELDSRHISRRNSTASGLGLIEQANPGVETNLAVVGASGAEIDHVDEPQPEDATDPAAGLRNYPMTSLAPTSDVDFASVSLGGNDAGFAAIAEQLARNDMTREQIDAFLREQGLADVVAAPGEPALDELAQGELDPNAVNLTEKLAATLREISKRHGGVPIMVSNYPEAIDPALAEDGWFVDLTEVELQAFRDHARALNARIAEAVELCGCGAQLVDNSDAFAGREFNAPDSLIHDIWPWTQQFPPEDHRDQEALHPTLEGADVLAGRMAAAIARALDLQAPPPGTAVDPATLPDLYVGPRPPLENPPTTPPDGPLDFGSTPPVPPDTEPTRPDPAPAPEPQPAPDLAPTDVPFDFPISYEPGAAPSDGSPGSPTGDPQFVVVVPGPPMPLPPAPPAGPAPVAPEPDAAPTPEPGPSPEPEPNTQSPAPEPEPRPPSESDVVPAPAPETEPAPEPEPAPAPEPAPEQEPDSSVNPQPESSPAEPPAPEPPPSPTTPPVPAPGAPGMSNDNSSGSGPDTDSDDDSDSDSPPTSERPGSGGAPDVDSDDPDGGGDGPDVATEPPDAPPDVAEPPGPAGVDDGSDSGTRPRPRPDNLGGDTGSDDSGSDDSGSDDSGSDDSGSDDSGSDDSGSDDSGSDDSGSDDSGSDDSGSDDSGSDDSGSDGSGQGGGGADSGSDDAGTDDSGSGQGGGGADSGADDADPDQSSVDPSPPGPDGLGDGPEGAPEADDDGSYDDNDFDTDPGGDPAPDAEDPGDALVS